MPNRRESEFARKLTQKVFSELKKAYLVLSDRLVSVDNHVDAIMEMIGAGTSGTRVIGIHGMGGIGKTTIAKMIYNKLSSDFENCCCYIRDIRETVKGNGIQCLQNQLISDILKIKCMDIKDIDEGIQTIKDRLSNKRVLLLLDDVEKENHVNALVGKRDWLGRGSKIIITTRNKDILEVPEVDCSYELSGMDTDQSLQLFSKHAFRKDYPLDEYIVQSKRAIHIARGLPLTLEVLGSLLCRTKKEKWDLTLNKLENVPHATVQSKLQISYDALDVRQQHIFLDIACLFVGYNKNILIHFWDESKYPEDAMEVLQNMSLIKITKNNKVWMHDQFRDLGREIVRQKSEMKIKKQSRVWDPKEGSDLLWKHKGDKEVEALRLKFDHQHSFTYEDFKSLSNLKFLEVDGLEENFRAHEALLLPTNCFQENSDLLPQLRWLSWHNILLEFKITNFFTEDVVILDLSWSQITHGWKGWSHMKVMKNLKVLNLTGCRHLMRTPNFSAHVNLERLILKGCENLVEIDESICQLKRLVFLDVRECGRLQRLPKGFGGLVALEELRIDWTSIREIPNCQGTRNLRIFTASRCQELALSPTIGDLASLEYLDLKYCESLKRLPDSIGNLKSLIELDIRHSNIKELPDSIGNLKNLKVVKMTCDFASNIPDSLWTIEKLEEIDAKGFHVKIGDCIYRNQSLRILSLDCAKIDAVPRLPESLIDLKLSQLYIKTSPDLSNLTNLKELVLEFNPWDDDGKSPGPMEKDPMPRWIGKLTKLESLILGSPYLTTLPTDISSLHPRLQDLDLKFSNLRCLSSLPSSLLSLYLTSCESLCSMDLSNLKKLSDLSIDCCAISEIRGLDVLENLQELTLVRLRQMEILPDLSNFNKLRGLFVSYCSKLVEIQGEPPQSLEHLNIYSCGSLQKLPDLSSLKRLQEVKIKCCWKLDVEAISSLCSKKAVIFVGEDEQSEGEDGEYESEQETDEFEYGSEPGDNESESEGEGAKSEFEFEYEG